MKDIRQFILEGKNREKYVDRATVGDFAKWACFGEMPDGKPGKVEPKDCQSLIDNGWFDYFDDSEKGLIDAAKFLNDNWEKNIKVISQETPNDWEISFKLDGKEYVAAFITYFGDEFQE